MLSSPRRPSSTMRIFSSAENCRRVARRMSFTTCSAGSFTGPDFCLIFAPSKATMSQKSSLLQPAKSDDVDGLSSTASKCQSVVARSATKREAVRGKGYQNWRRSRQELFSGPRLSERRRSCREAQVDALENALVLFANRAKLYRHGS